MKKTCIAIGVLQALSFNYIVTPAFAATITVTNSFDSGDGCTLREAIESVNNGRLIGGCQQTGEVFGVNDTIAFNGRSVSNLQSVLKINQAVSINPDGDHVTIDSLGNDRVFDVRESNLSSNTIDVTFHNLTIRGGQRPLQLFAPVSFAGGGGIRVGQGTNVEVIQCSVEGNSTDFAGGGILVENGGSLKVSDSEISNNTATFGGGGGIFSYNELTITGSSISDNTAGGFGGGIATSNGFIGNPFLKITDSDISNNQLIGDSSLGGGGISFGGGEFDLVNSTVSNNSASEANGGGLFFGTTRLSVTRGDPIVATLVDSIVSDNQSVNGGAIAIFAGSLELNKTTISGNIASIDAGAIYVEQSSVSFFNSTISGNSAAQNGGAISTVFNTTNIQTFISNLTIFNSTVSANSAGLSGGAIHLDVNNGLANSITAANSLITGNAATNFNEIFNSGSQVSLLGVNLFGDNSRTSAQAFFAFNPRTNDITATSDGNRPTPTSEILQPLTNNGGPTQTHALTQSSPAIDAANASICAAGPINNRDQRGQLRSGGSVCDIGSFEIIDPTTFFVVPLPNGGSVIFDL